MKNDKPLIEPQLYQEILDTGKVESIDNELDTTGWMVAAGTNNKDFKTTFFYINSVMDFIGASISLPLPFVNQSSTYISFVNGKQKYDAFSATASKDKPDHHIDSEINRIKVNLGLLDNYSLGYSLSEYKAMLDDKVVGSGRTVNQALSLDIIDIEKAIPGRKDTPLSVGLGVMYDFKGDWNIALDAGTLKLICTIDRNGVVSFTGFAQWGIGTF
jgi:hypothetical protein